MGALSALHSCYGPSPSQTLPCDLALCLEIIVLGEVCFFKLRSVFVEGRPIFFFFKERFNFLFKVAQRDEDDAKFWENEMEVVLNEGSQ